MNAKRSAVLMALATIPAGCMVGPDYKPPQAPLAPQFRSVEPTTQPQTAPNLAQWWTVFSDPVLSELVATAYRQNPTLQSAAVRVLEAEAQYGVAKGLLFPQQQQAFGDYTRNQLSRNQANGGALERSFSEWQLGAAASWEIDIWGRYRRGIQSADASVLASIANYDDVLVTLISSVANEYLTIRILQERLVVTQANVTVQSRGLDVAKNRFEGGTATELDRLQASSLLRDTEAAVPDIEAGIRQAEARLCALLGVPPRDLAPILGDTKRIPVAPASVAVGIPADLLRRRPDVRRAEYELAAQSARIGIAKADLYPSFFLFGDVRVVSEDAGKLFEGDSVQAFGGPGFRWNVLNYGRIHNEVRVQDARFQALIGTYEASVLQAQAEVESAMAGYLGAQRQARLLEESVAASQRAVEVAETQYRGGIADYTRVLNTQQFLQTEQDRLVSTRGAIALNLVSLYRALGGGWEIRGRQVALDPKIQAQMRERTNWGKALPTATAGNVAPASRPVSP